MAKRFTTVVKHIDDPLGIQVHVLELLRLLLFLLFLELGSIEPLDTRIRRLNHLKTFLPFFRFFLNFLFTRQVDCFFVVFAPNVVILFLLLIRFLAVGVEFIGQLLLGLNFLML